MEEAALDKLAARFENQGGRLMADQDTNTRIFALKASMSDKPHGTRARYIGGPCRCLPCRAANSRYQTGRDKAIRTEGDRRGLVPALTAREYLLRLQDKGIGYKAVADAAGVARSVVSKGLSGQRKSIRANTDLCRGKGYNILAVV